MLDQFRSHEDDDKKYVPDEADQGDNIIDATVEDSVNEFVQPMFVHG